MIPSDSRLARFIADRSSSSRATRLRLVRIFVSFSGSKGGGAGSLAAALEEIAVPDRDDPKAARVGRREGSSRRMPLASI